MKLKVSEKDHRKYFVEKGEPGFSVEHNKHVIEKSIRDADRIAKRKKGNWLDSVKERADAVAWFLASKKAQSGYGPEKYFGKRWLAYLRGQEIVDQLKVLGSPFTKHELIARIHAKEKKERQANS